MPSTARIDITIGSPTSPGQSLARVIADSLSFIDTVNALGGGPTGLEIIVDLADVEVAAGEYITLTASVANWTVVTWQYQNENGTWSVMGETPVRNGNQSSVTLMNPADSWHHNRNYRAIFGDGTSTVTTRVAKSTVTGTTTEPPPAGVTDLLSADFQNATVTSFNNASTMQTQLTNAFGSRRNSYSLQHLAIVADGSNKYLRQQYVPNSSVPPDSPTDVVGFLPNKFTGKSEAWLSYRFYFEPGWEWTEGGKMPGLAGGTEPTGGNGSPNGFSARMMWRSNARMECYLYHYPGTDSSSDQTTTYGRGLPFKNADGSDYTFQTGRWYTITQRVVLNTGPNNKDGRVQCWIDGVQVLDRGGLRFIGPNTTAPFLIDGFRYESFYGGNSASYIPTKTTYARYDDFKAASTVGGVDRPTVGTNPNAKDEGLAQLFAVSPYSVNRPTNSEGHSTARAAHSFKLEAVDGDNEFYGFYGWGWGEGATNHKTVSSIRSSSTPRVSLWWECWVEDGQGLNIPEGAWLEIGSVHHHEKVNNTWRRHSTMNDPESTGWCNVMQKAPGELRQPTSVMSSKVDVAGGSHRFPLNLIRNNASGYHGLHGVFSTTNANRWNFDANATELFGQAQVRLLDKNLQPLRTATMIGFTISMDMHPLTSNNSAAGNPGVGHGAFIRVTGDWTYRFTGTWQSLTAAQAEALPIAARRS